MKNLYKILSVLLCFVILMPLLISCGAGKEEGDDKVTSGTPPEIGRTEDAPEFPEYNFNEEFFTVFARSRTAASYQSKHIYADQINGELLNDEVYKRNMMVEEKYSVKIRLMEHDTPSTQVTVQILAGEPEFDVILERANQMASIALQGMLYDFYDLPNVNFDAPWWDSNANSGYTIAGKLFFGSNDISVSYFSSARFVYFNGKMIEDYKLDDPYELVAQNKWTLDKFLVMVQSITTDLNGKKASEYGDYQFGMLTEDGQSNGTHAHMLTGLGVNLTEKAADGTVVPSLYSDKTIMIFDKLRQVLLDRKCTLNYGQLSDGADMSSFSHQFDYGRSLFAQGRFLFMQSNISIIEQLNDMELFGIAPNPKYDENQKDYAHRLDPYTLMFTIPQNTRDPEMVGAILEYWAYESNRTFFPKYYEVFLKNRRMHSEKAGPILDIIKTSIIYDPAEIFKCDLKTVSYNAYITGNLASLYAAYEPALLKQIEDINNAVTAK